MLAIQKWQWKLLMFHAKVAKRDAKIAKRHQMHALHASVRYWPNGFTQPNLVLEMTN
ncbi:hypothetical protein [Achromobacter sp. MFA1 R4]|uniref:hypothetical protein n=1 Tax=Achromobacter sp. MFA1 R4 TaxID=1881016 RepID=UPI000953783F|nr:hypothetical protein [Achromobacter sp. MFA1 R4]SIT06274.1 hypothetical protein SAMN05428937_0539 [Achromobacter sp. MFA1 R4]